MWHLRGTTKEWELCILYSKKEIGIEAMKLQNFKQVIACFK